LTLGDSVSCGRSRIPPSLYNKILLLPG